MSLLHRCHQTQVALQFVELNTPVSIIALETGLSATMLRRMYIEHTGQRPPRGVLPFSADWFLQWRPNIHASLFANLYVDLMRTRLTAPERLTAAYRHYLSELACFDDSETLLSMARAWTLLRFCRSQILQLTPCHRCQARYISAAYQPSNNFTCGICHTPSHAGYRHRSKQLRT
ncbi:FlhC family transcriptional regulator [Zymobacter sp. IVIA_12111.31 C1]|uniref:FlhC family transcriptional regulator n=1 Tax=Zymobacter sp. IVIA_12111.31 C1 TaxID=3394854 RepID=UPI0039C11D03